MPEPIQPPRLAVEGGVASNVEQADEKFQEALAKFRHWGHSILDSHDEIDSIFNYPKLKTFLDQLSSKYGRQHLRKYRLYHIIVGSTPGADMTLFDLPGEDSIYSWIMALKIES